jgi:formiminoglutamase
MERTVQARNGKNWKGRIDSLEDVDAFRWHQCIRKIDLNTIKDTDNLSIKNSFCFIGFICDEGVLRNLGRPGASKGPQYLRKEMANLAWDNERNIALFDAGNVFCKNRDLETAQAVLSIAISKILDLGLIPILLGGGHDIAFAHFNGITNYLDNCEPNKTLGIVNFDAHFDLRPLKEDKGSSGTMFRQIADVCQKKIKHLITIALVYRPMRTLKAYLKQQMS